MSWFVSAATKRYELEEGWIEIKNELDYGERERLSNGAMTRVSGSDESNAGIDLDIAKFNVLKLQTWLVDWSADQPITRQTIEALRPSVADAIEEIINQHQEALEAEKNE